MPSCSCGATGIRLGECIHLPLDCLQQVGTEQCALHVPLGKLHTERLVPADTEVRRIVERILTLRSSSPLMRFVNSQGFLLPRQGVRAPLAFTLRSVLEQAAKRAGCFTHVTPHRLRHSFATEMLRLGVSLPALMKLLGHKDIRMTLRYAEVTQQDLQREFHQARQMQLMRIICPRSHSPKISQSSVSPASARHWRLHVIFWKCIAVSWAMRKSAVHCSASINASSPLLHNCKGSIPMKNEEILAG